MLDLSLLVTFLAVRRQGSFTAAARALGLAQPTVTAQIRALEAQLDQQLFVRTRTGSRPTSAAEVLAHRVGAHVDALTEVVGQVLAPGDPFARPVHLAGPAEILQRRALAALAPLHSQGLRLRVTVGLASDLLEGLRRGRFDLMISTIRPGGRELTVATLADEELLLVGAPRFSGTPAARLDSLPMLTYDEDLALFRRYWKVAFRRSPSGEPVLVVPDLRALATAAAAGAGISVLPRYLVADQLASGSLVCVHEVPDGVINTLFLAWRPGTEPAVATVRDRLRAEARAW